MKKYKNPPLVESVCEIVFTTKEWTPIIPGLFYNEIKDNFPIISQRPGIGFAINPGVININQTTNNSLIQYLNNEKNTIIQLSNNILTINKLPKYDGWNNYFGIIKETFTALNKVLKIESINRLAFRTVNKIDIEEHSMDNLKKYLNIYPEHPKTLNDPCNSIQFNLEFPLKPNEEILAISVMTLKEEPNLKAPLLFQINMIQLSNINGIEWIDEVAHKKSDEIFESCITEFSKQKFDQ